MCSYVAEGTVMNNYAHIFDLLTRLRQVKDLLIVKLNLSFILLLICRDNKLLDISVVTIAV